MAELPSAVAKIAVLRANGIGDFLFAVPALEALRARFPTAEIVLLGAPWHASFLAGRPGPVDRVVVVPKSRGVRDEGDEDPEALGRFFEAMRAEGFDLALQLHGGGRFSNPFTKRLGARMTAGLRAPDAVPLDRWVPYVYFQPEVLRFLEVVSLVDARPVTLEPRIAVLPDDLEASRRAVPDSDAPLVAIHPGVSDPRRRWPTERFAAVADALTERGARVVVTGAGSERAVVEQMLSSTRAAVEDAGGRLSLRALAGLYARCKLVVANDSGPLHLAEAVGAPTVGIYWCGNLINAEPITRAWRRPQLSWRLECPRCGRSCIHDHCEHTDSFVAEVPLDDVLSEALDLLKGPLRSSARRAS